MADDSLEAALVAAERDIDEALKSAGALLTGLRKAKVAASTGQLRDLRRGLAAATVAAGQASDALLHVESSFDLDEQAHLASGAYTKELLATAADEGLQLFEEDDRLLCYPSILRMLPGDAAVEIDKQRERRIRPSVLVARLKARQAQGPRFKPEPFLESLHTAYRLVVARGDKQADAVVRVVEVWDVLTLLPGQAREYTKQEFARDLYLLDQSGVTRTREGRQLRWSASTGTKGAGVLTTVARSGAQQRYWGISFS